MWKDPKETCTFKKSTELIRRLNDDIKWHQEQEAVQHYGIHFATI
jgi:hypothetical protein